MKNCQDPHGYHGIGGWVIASASCGQKLISSHRESHEDPVSDGIRVSKWELADKSQSFIVFTCLEAFVKGLFLPNYE